MYCYIWNSINVTEKVKFQEVWALFSDLQDGIPVVLVKMILY
jgi:hypothetical protein